MDTSKVSGKKCLVDIAEEYKGSACLNIFLRFEERQAMQFPFDLLSWNFAFFALIVVILTLPFIYDNERKTLTYHGKFFFYYFLVSLSAVGFCVVFVFNAKNVKNCWYAADVLKRLSSVLGIRWELRDMENMIKGGAVVVANHQSSLDILGMFEMWRIMGKCTAIAKKELFHFWPFGLCAWLAGIVFIDRSSTAKAYSTLAETKKLLQKDETKIFFFPEGTRNTRVNKTKQLLPFKKGAFKMAILSQVPVVPVVFSPYYFIDVDEKYFGKGKMTVKALPPIPTNDLTEKDTEDLMQKTYDIMTKAFEELCKEVIATLPEDHNMVWRYIITRPCSKPCEVKKHQILLLLFFWIITFAMCFSCLNVYDFKNNISVKKILCQLMVKTKQIH